MEDRAQELERRLERPLLLAALLTIPALVIYERDLGQPWDTVGWVLTWVTWLAFLAEVVLMLRVTPDRWRWLRDHPLDVAIVLFTPPFAPASLQAARVMRLLWLLRLVKAAMLARRTLSTEGVRDAAVLALITILGGGTAFAAVERQQDLSMWDGVWWAVTTVTTVGYGDSYPETTAGRVIAVVVMVVGIGFVALLTGAAAERFVASRREEGDERDEVVARLDEVLRRLDELERRDLSGGRSAPGPPPR